MKKILKFLGKVFKTSWQIFKLAYLISMLVFALALAYFFWLYYPVFKPPAATQPEGESPDDCIIMTWYNDADNEKIIQEVTIFRDGRSKVLLVREMNDPDIPDNIAEWELSRDKELKLIEFRREGVLLQGETKMLFYDLIQAGLLDLKNEEFELGKKLFISVSAGSSFNAVSGPEAIIKYTPYPPEKLMNQNLWDRIHKIIRQKRNLEDFTTKTRYIK